jgi:hypothetical protein
MTKRLVMQRPGLGLETLTLFCVFLLYEIKLIHVKFLHDPFKIKLVSVKFLYDSCETPAFQNRHKPSRSIVISRK